MSKLRFYTNDGVTTIRAVHKSTGKWKVLGTCHPATVSLIKRDGIKNHAHLIQIGEK